MGFHWFETALLPEGWARNVRLGVEGGRIVSVEVDAPPNPDDQRAAIGLPGLPNLHSHSFQRAMAGLTEVRGPTGDSFWSWRELMYRFVSLLSPDDVEAIAAQAFAEMLEAGFTRVGEFHYLHHDVDGAAFADAAEMASRIAAAAETTGIGLTLLPVFYAHSGFGGAPPSEAQWRFVNSLDGFARLRDAARTAIRHLPDAVVGVAPHSLRAVTEAELVELTRMDGPLHIHIAEQVKEVDDCLAWSGARPVEWLVDRFSVDDRWCLVHATHMTPDELQRLAASGAVAGLCPITEANLGDGVFPAARYLAQGGVFGVGSDSNVRIDAAEELRLLEYGQRLTERGRNVLAAEPGASTGGSIYRGALAGGMQALGVGSVGLVEGASADFVTLDACHPDIAGRSGDTILDALIFAGVRSPKDVWRGGRQVVADGRHLKRADISRRYRQTLDRLLA